SFFMARASRPVRATVPRRPAPPWSGPARGTGWRPSGSTPRPCTWSRNGLPFTRPWPGCAGGRPIADSWTWRAWTTADRPWSPAETGSFLPDSALGIHVPPERQAPVHRDHLAGHVGVRLQQQAHHSGHVFRTAETADHPALH